MTNKTALQWAKERTACPEAIAWLKRQGPITMSEAYKVCPNVAWMWFALAISQKGIDDIRKRHLEKAMEAFQHEFYATTDCDNIMFAYDDMDQRELSRWADRLREYVTP